MSVSVTSPRRGALLICADDDDVTRAVYPSVEDALAVAQQGWEDNCGDVNEFAWWHIIDLESGFVVLSEMPQLPKAAGVIAAAEALRDAFDVNYTAIEDAVSAVDAAVDTMRKALALAEGAS